MNDISELVEPPAVRVFWRGRRLYLPLTAVVPVHFPLGPEDYRRGISAADGTTAPASDSALWLVNPGGLSRLRVFATVAFTGGTSPSIDVMPYVRSPSDSIRGEVGQLALVNVAGSITYVFDVIADGDDVLLFVQAVNGSPAAWSASFQVSWR